MSGQSPASERWRPVPDFPDYEVSDQGRLRSLDRIDLSGRRRKGTSLRLFPLPQYLGAWLFRDGRRTRCQIHLLVLEVFVGPRPSPKHVARHLDDDKTNNALSNLTWGTRSENAHDSVRNDKHHHSRRTHCPEGHAFTDENTHLLPGGGRRCRLCWRKYQREWKQRSRNKK
jgi:hypothetical protein